MPELPLPELRDLPSFSQWQEYFGDVVRQLEKDFSTTGLDPASIPETGTYPDLFTGLLPVITRLIDQRFEQFAQLLYRVDISEAQLKKAARLYPGRSFPELATELIILRELHKVLIRRRYGK